MKRANNKNNANRRRSRTCARRGFTLIELMVVIVIIGLLSGVIAPNVMQYIAKARVTTAKAQIAIFSSAIRTYYMDTEEYPQSLEDLVSEPGGITGWNSEGYLLDTAEVPLDPWKHDYEYRIPGANGPFEVICLGKDGQEGGTDEDADIYSGASNRTNEPGGPGH